MVEANGQICTKDIHLLTKPHESTPSRSTAHPPTIPPLPPPPTHTNPHTLASYFESPRMTSGAMYTAVPTPDLALLFISCCGGAGGSGVACRCARMPGCVAQPLL